MVVVALPVEAEVEDLVEKFSTGISMVTSLLLVVSYLILVVAPHMFINAYKNILAIVVATEYSFPQAEKVKEYLKWLLLTLALQPQLLLRKKRRKEELMEELDDDMGFSAKRF